MDEIEEFQFRGHVGIRLQPGRYVFDPRFCARCGDLAAWCERCGHKGGQPLKLRVWAIWGLVLAAFVLGGALGYLLAW